MQHFGVSRLALLYRLQNLNLISQKTAEAVREMRVRETAQRLGITFESTKYPGTRLPALAMQAWRRGVISAGRAAELWGLGLEDFLVYVRDMSEQPEGYEGTPLVGAAAEAWEKNLGVVIADACLFITFGNADVLGLLTELRAHRVLVSGRSLMEVTRPPTLTALQAALAAGTVSAEAIDLGDPAEQEALRRFDSRVAFRNRGDAEVMALAVTRGYIVGSDDRAVRSAANAEIGISRMAGTVDVLKWAVSEGRLTKAEAVNRLRALDVFSGIERQVSARGQTLDDLF
jgi:hypothetical protein